MAEDRVQHGLGPVPTLMGGQEQAEVPDLSETVHVGSHRAGGDGAVVQTGRTPGKHRFVRLQDGAGRFRRGSKQRLDVGAQGARESHNELPVHTLDG